MIIEDRSQSNKKSKLITDNKDRSSHRAYSPVEASAEYLALENRDAVVSKY